MKAKFTFPLLFFILLSCSDDDNNETVVEPPVNTNVAFSLLNTLIVPGSTTEISAFDPETNKLFTVDPNGNQIVVFDLTDPSKPILGSPISVAALGTPNSVAVFGGQLAVAVEASDKQQNGKILLLDTATQLQISTFDTGALPDMVTFSPDGRFILTADEGEPNDAYTVDPKGSVTIIDLSDNSTTNLFFDAFETQLEQLKAGGFRVFGPNANLAKDVEPEYITVSDDSQTAWVVLQENNALARINLLTKQIESILPLGFKDHSLPENSLDASNRDNVSELKNWPVFGMYLPDGIKFFSTATGGSFLVTANEGDSRDYGGFSEEKRIKNLVLDPTAFPDAASLQLDENLGRLKVTNTLGDTDNDGDFDALYAYGARSFSIWSVNGELIYDSGNDIAEIQLQLSPNTFNADGGEIDGRSDDKGAEPESVEILQLANRTILFVGLERTNQILVFDISVPSSPEFLQLLSAPGDAAPEGVLVIPAEQSPTGKDLLIVSNEGSGTISIYQNE